jgi:hypothetical protein
MQKKLSFEVKDSVKQELEIKEVKVQVLNNSNEKSKLSN